MGRDGAGLWWSAPSCWRGETAAVVGGGWSLDPADVEACRGRVRLAAINRAVELAPWADLLMFYDRRFWTMRREAVDAFAGIRVTLENPDMAAHGIHCVGNYGQTGFFPHPWGVMTGSNTGYGAVHLLAHMGVARILLLGFDMRPGPDGRTHWHDGYEDNGRKVHHDRGVYARSMVPKFATIVPALEERGIEVINCTPGSALTCFPSMPLAAALPGVMA